MNTSDIQAFIRGILWIILFIAPLIFSALFAHENTEENDKVLAIFVALVLQTILIICIGHSWGK